MEDLKRILIVDDSEIDRTVLRSILKGEFEVIEADNGYSALDIILKRKECFDAVLLDVSMPFFDGISVLRVLRENNLQDVQIFMITAEATKENIEKASQYNIAEFIKKPFDKHDVLYRLRSKLRITEKVSFSKADMTETRRFVSDLDFIYKRYLSSLGLDRKKDIRRAYFMKLLLKKASERNTVPELNDFQTEMICKAAYLCNIGNMLLQNTPVTIDPRKIKSNNDTYEQHPLMGNYLLKLNYSWHCTWFVDTCAEICLHHHERFDGKGFPQGCLGANISIYAQMCGLLERFEELFSTYSEHNEKQFDYVIDQLLQDSGFVARNVVLYLKDSKNEIIKYYRNNMASQKNNQLK